MKTTVKPVTAFAKGNPVKSQKPTAKVKPQMKCVVSPTAEAQPIIQQAADGRPSSLSRMNDLDDISLTDPLPLPINNGAGTTGRNYGNVIIVVHELNMGPRLCIAQSVNANFTKHNTLQ